MHHFLELEHLPWLMTSENILIASCYLIISGGIIRGIWRNREAGMDALVVTVAAIFFSCAVGHGFHAAGMLGLPHAVGWQTVADLTTVIIALRFLSFYQSFDLLSRFSQIFASKVELESKNQLLETAMIKLKQTHTQLIQEEKMSSLGQLVAGIAHEINNPVNFIHGNLIHVQQYVKDLLWLLENYQEHSAVLPSPQIQAATAAIDLDFLQEDLPKVLNSMAVGSDRIRKIVLSLRNFSRMDESDLKTVDIHEGLESTLLILQHRLKGQASYPNIEILKDYGALPGVECYPGALNQVFMNILVNAIDAIEEQYTQTPNLQADSGLGRITIRTSVINPQWIAIAITDNGIGIPAHLQQRIFDPFFTTKPVGKGPGIGMSISYQIVVENHKGKLTCSSTEGQGTELIIQLPLKQDAEPSSPNPQTHLPVYGLVT